MKSATTSLKSFMVHNSNLKVCNLEVINDAKFNSRKILDEQNIFDQGYYLRKNLERDNSFLIPYLKTWKNTAIIIVLRDPIERFKSHIHHSLLKNVRRNGNRLSILNHTYKFPNKIFYELDIKKTSEDELRSHNFFARGLYYEMLKELLENVPNERFIFIGTDKISNSAIPKMILNHIRDISNFKVEIDLDKKISIENSREMMKNDLYFGLKNFLSLIFKFDLLTIH